MKFEISVIEKTRVNEELEKLKKFCGIEIKNLETGHVFRPTYPFAELENKAILQEFVELYEKELLDFYMNGWNYSFGRFCIVNEYKDTKYGISRDFDLSMATEFRDRWFIKGVVFY